MRLRSRPPTPDEHVEGGDEGSLCASLARDLAVCRSGVAFVYQCLDRVAAATAADDIVVVVDDPLVGRQVFRNARRPIDGAWASRVASVAGPGLYLFEGDLDADVARSIAALCAVGLRLDVIGHDASHDALTGLLNRRSFDDALSAAVAQSRRYGWPFSLVLLDIRGFKGVNDRLGHAAGDSALRTLGTALREGMRAGDVAARIGGDEFALILPNADPALLPRFLKRLEERVLESVPGGGDLALSAGIARAPSDAVEADQLYRLADRRLYDSRSR